MIPGELDGWADFVYERRELKQHTDNLPKDVALSGYDKEIAAEWLALNPGQKSYFVQRSKKLLDVSGYISYAHCAFWNFYYDNYFSLRTEPA